MVTYIDAELENGTMLITGPISDTNSAEELYIFLEHILTSYFYDIYKNEIENKSLTYIEYYTILNQLIKKNNITRFFLLDSNFNIGYNFDVSDDFLKSDFIDNLVLDIFGR